MTPGYWRRDDLTSTAFDEEGFLRTGDALDWIDAGNRQSGFRYDGRIAEDFKLATGTWVRVGALRTHLLKHLTPEVRDVVIAGENRNYIAVLALASATGLVEEIDVARAASRQVGKSGRSGDWHAQRVLASHSWTAGSLSMPEI